MRAMEKDRARRYQTVSEFAADVDRSLHGVARIPPYVLPENYADQYRGNTEKDKADQAVFFKQLQPVAVDLVGMKSVVKLTRPGALRAITIGRRGEVGPGVLVHYGW